MAHIVIIGNSVSGHSAALNIRARDPRCSLTLISSEPYPFYDRRRLGDFMQGAIREEDLFLCAGDFYVKQNISVKTGCTVTALNPLKKTLSFKEKGTLSYDILVVATGKRHAGLTVPGAKKPGVVPLYTLDDVKRFKERAVTQPVCIIGWNKGAAAMAQAIAACYGIEVKVIAPSGVDTTSLPAAVEVIHIPVTEIIGDGGVQAVKLSSGKAIGVGLVVGMEEEPVVDFLRHTLIRVSPDGIEVDDMMRTTVEKVYACGAVACSSGTKRIKTWSECAEEACYLAGIIAKEMEHQCQTYS